jgi:hypothetical protein
MTPGRDIIAARVLLLTLSLVACWLAMALWLALPPAHEFRASVFLHAGMILANIVLLAWIALTLVLGVLAVLSPSSWWTE